MKVEVHQRPCPSLAAPAHECFDGALARALRARRDDQPAERLPPGLAVDPAAARLEPVPVPVLKPVLKPVRQDAPGHQPATAAPVTAGTQRLATDALWSVRLTEHGLPVTGLSLHRTGGAPWRVQLAKGSPVSPAHRAEISRRLERIGARLDDEPLVDLP